MQRNVQGRGLVRLGLALMLGGVLLLGWVGWQFFGTNITSDRAAQHQRHQLVQSWGDPGPSSATTPSATAVSTAEPEPAVASAGSAFALLRVPRFGASYEIPIVEGVDPDDLAKGVGHFPGTAMPGQIGNFAIAGHRVTHGEPFRHLLGLNRGDKIIVETRTAIYTYEVDHAPRDLTVDASTTWVLDPVPGKPQAKPTTATITLTTCQDLFHSPDRSVGFGHLVSTRAK